MFTVKRLYSRMQRVISSPLTRALQTAIGCFGPATPIQVCHTAFPAVVCRCSHRMCAQICALITEKVNPSQADMGRPPAMLRLDFPSHAANLVGLDTLSDEWWPSAGTDGEPDEVLFTARTAVDRAL